MKKHTSLIPLSLMIIGALIMAVCASMAGSLSRIGSWPTVSIGDDFYLLRLSPIKESVNLESEFSEDDF